MIENNLKYLDTFLKLSSIPGVKSKPIIELTDEEVKNNLCLQIQTMLKNYFQY